MKFTAKGIAKGCIVTLFLPLIKFIAQVKKSLLCSCCKCVRTVPSAEKHVFSMSLSSFRVGRTKSKLSPKRISSPSDIQDPLQTTSQYLIQQVETTVDEETLPGKLPETPLRVEPPSSYKVLLLFVCLL